MLLKKATDSTKISELVSLFGSLIYETTEDGRMFSDVVEARRG